MFDIGPKERNTRFSREERKVRQALRACAERFGQGAHEEESFLCALGDLCAKSVELNLNLNLSLNVFQ